MLIITSRSASGTEMLDLHLPINGKMTQELNTDELRRELLSLSVPGVTPHHGWTELATIYARWRRATTPDPVTGKLPGQS
jgi:hypothetical protein